MKKTSLILFALLGMGMAANAQTTEKDSTMTKLNVLESIANGVTNGYLLIENGVVKGYKAIETGTVKGFTAVNDAITLKLFGKDGETIEETKARLNANAETSMSRSKEIIENNMKATEERVKNSRPDKIK